MIIQEPSDERIGVFQLTLNQVEGSTEYPELSDFSITQCMYEATTASVPESTTQSTTSSSAIETTTPKPEQMTVVTQGLKIKLSVDQLSKSSPLIKTVHQ